MIRPLRSLRDRAFPDLLRVEDAYDRDRVWGVATKESGLGWVLPIVAYAPVFPWAYVAVNLRLSLAAMMLVMVPAFMVVSMGAQSLAVFRFRRKLDRSIWGQLRERSVPVCIHCGYDLTGNASGVCPECGRGLGGAGGKP